MIREYDARDEFAPATPGAEAAGPEDDVATRRRALEQAAERVSETLPGDERVAVARLDEATGGAAVVVSRGGEARRGDYVRRALAHVVRIGDVLGLEAAQPAEFLPDPDFQETSQGAVAVHLQQLHAGIPVYDGAQTVRFAPDGTLTEVAGRTHAIAGGVDAVPTTTAAEALRTALRFLSTPGDGEATELDPFGEPFAQHVSDLTTAEPAVVTGPAPQPDRATVFTASQLDGPSTVRLLWFPVGRDDLRLAWSMVVALPGGGQWRILVDAHDDRVLLSRSLVHSLSGLAMLHARGGGEPAEEVAMAVDLGHYPVAVPDDLPDGFPDDWLRDDSTDGENVRALRVDDGSTVRGRVVDGTVRFEPDDDTDDLVVHLFYFNGLMHDLLYLLGFRETDGNFQRSNRGRGGPAGDAVVARVHPGPVFGTANMRTPVDGRPPEMNMGLVSSTGRHTALDVDVVVHEYTHGLTNRLVGGPMNEFALDEVQSGGMGEGWGDYFACVLTGRDTVASWVVGRSGGIRSAPYDEDYPNTFADVGRPPFTGVHALGEIWCATLLALDRSIGTALAAQLVVDALKLSVANPSFLDMRDAILLAADDHAGVAGLGDHERAALRHAVWAAFAGFGMGPAARTDGPSLRGIVADFTTPPAPEPPAPPAPPAPATLLTAAATPEREIPDDSRDGIADSLGLDTDGVLRSLEVDVAITHTFRGDLVVSLETPGGLSLRLHDRAGGGADDLVATWRSADEGVLAAVVGSPAGGTWTLRVVDHARRDVGVLRSWALRAEVEPPRPVEVLAVAPAAPIPDDDPVGVTSSVTSTGSGPVRRLSLHVEITHTYVGDLEVVLRAPDGSAVTLHDRRGGHRDDLVRDYGSGDGEPLAPLVGVAGTGTWKLHVVDHAGRDVGTLDGWRLELER